MKGQVSIEFMSLLAIALLASAVLVTEMNDRAMEYSRSSPYTEAEKLAQKVAYKLDYTMSSENTSVKLDFSPRLEENYNITVVPRQVVVNFDAGSSSFPTRYQGGKISFNTTENYQLSKSAGELVVRE